jgi:hypothetical protein
MVRRQVRHKHNRALRREFDVIAVYENQAVVSQFSKAQQCTTHSAPYKKSKRKYFCEIYD